MPHKNQKFFTYFLLLSALWLLLLTGPAVSAVTGGKCDRLGEPLSFVENCSRLLPISGPLPDGVEMLSTVIVASGLILAGVASFELARRQG